MKDCIYIKNKSNIINIKSQVETTYTELIFYFTMILNILYMSFYSFYGVMRSKYNLIMLILSVIMILNPMMTKLYVDMYQAVIFVVFITFSFFGILANNSGFGVMSFYLWPLVIIFTVKYCPFSENYVDRICIIMSLVWIISIISTFRYGESYFARFKEMVLQGTINPNTTACVIGCSFPYFTLFVEKKTRSRTWTVLISIISILAIYRLRSRSAMVTLVIIVVLDLFFREEVSHSRTIAYLILGVIFLAAMAFPFVYVMMFRNTIGTGEIVVAGKDIFSGRQYIWMRLWEYLMDNKTAFLWGIGTNTSFYHNTFNLHHAYIQIFAQFGSLILLAYILYFSWSVYAMYDQKGYLSDIQFKCFLVIVFIVTLGTSETVLTFMPIAIFYGTAIGIGYRERKKEEVPL